MKYPDSLNCTVAVIGMGYVGLPLAIELGKSRKCYLSNKIINRRILAFDISLSRIESLKNSIDLNDQIDKEEFKKVKNIEYEFDTNKLHQADIFIITVPTPIDESCIPDLTNLKKASKTVGIALRKRSENILNSGKTCPVVIFESTVYPGATEEICIPIIEAESNLLLNAEESGKGFVCGYSPERINPGDKERTLINIVKVTSGSKPCASKWIDKFYGSIIKAGTYNASSIKIAEAAKVIENTQRDLNIALINELSIIFRKMKIDTLDVLEAASTKWNFLNFKPGLVGGHCIGVDPYYLTYKSKKIGYYPQVVLAGRRINDKMGAWVIEQLILEMARKSMIIGGSNILILGLTFKENCKDIRNTRVVDMVEGLNKYNINVDVVDPLIDCNLAKKIYKINLSNQIVKDKKYSGVILAVAHNEFVRFGLNDWKNLVIENGIFLDVKGVMPRSLGPIRI